MYDSTPRKYPRSGYFLVGICFVGGLMHTTAGSQYGERVLKKIKKTHQRELNRVKEHATSVFTDTVEPRLLHTLTT